MKLTSGNIDEIAQEHMNWLFAADTADDKGDREEWLRCIRKADEISILAGERFGEQAWSEARQD